MKNAIIAIAVLALLGGCAKEAGLVTGKLPVVAGTLEGGPWLAEDLNGGGIMDRARVDLTFDPGDQNTSMVHGQSGCNRYRGSWKQDGATIKLGPFASTMMACPPAVMDTEQKFLKTLEAVTTVTFEANGAAILTAPDGRRIRIRRESK